MERAERAGMAESGAYRRAAGTVGAGGPAVAPMSAGARSSFASQVMADCGSFGGETAAMPGIYREHEYDVAGFIVGTVRRDRLVLGEGIAPGDVVVALPSDGLHTNGYSLVRKVFDLDDDGREAALERLNRYEPS